MSGVVPAPAEAVCLKLQYVLRSVWILYLAIIVIVFLYFVWLICYPQEPRLRITKWAGKARSNIYVAETKEAPEAWVTSISEFCATRGSTGGKLLAAAFTAGGALQIVEASLLGEICIASPVAKAFLWAGGAGMIILSQVESADPYPEEAKHIERLKKIYAGVHAIGAIMFLCCTLTGVILVTSQQNYTWVGKGTAIAGAIAFLVAVLMQNLTGNWVRCGCCCSACSGETGEPLCSKPSECLLPQWPADRRKDHPRWGAIHAWLEKPRNRIVISRFTLLAENIGSGLLAFSACYLSIYQSVSGAFCTSDFFGNCL
jgi:hypothetical protein